MRGKEEQEVEVTKVGYGPGQARAVAAMKEEAAHHMMLTGPDTEVDIYIRHDLTGHSQVAQQHPFEPQAG